MSTDKYSVTLYEFADFFRSAQHLKAELNFLLWYGKKRLIYNMREWKNVDRKPTFTQNDPPYPYDVKNLYVNAVNNLWYETLWAFRPELSEIYYSELLQSIKKFEINENFRFNKGIVYGNLGVAQAAQMKLDEGFANILKALIEDAGYSTNRPEYNLFRRKLFTQFEERYVKKYLQKIITLLNIDDIPSTERFVEKFLELLNDDQRVFFDYTFARIMQNWNIWKDKENAFTANRLLAYTQDLCLFIEDFLKSKTPSSILSNKTYWTLKDLLTQAFPSIELEGCSANTINELDNKLTSDLDRQNQPEKCLRILLTLRNYSSHNIKSGTSANCIYARYTEILHELIRALCYIILFEYYE